MLFSKYIHYLTGTCSSIQVALDWLTNKWYIKLLSFRYTSKVYLCVGLVPVFSGRITIIFGRLQIQFFSLMVGKWKAMLRKEQRHFLQKTYSSSAFNLFVGFIFLIWKGSLFEMMHFQSCAWIHKVLNYVVSGINYGCVRCRLYKCNKEGK